MKKVLAIILSLVMLFSLAACGGTEGGDGEQKATTIKVAHWFAESHPQHQAFLKFKEIV